MASAYLEDSWDDHGANKCSGPEFVRRTMAALPNSKMCSHHLGQTLIDVRGDEAGAETYFLAVMTTERAGAEDVENLNFIGGRYVDVLLRAADGWRIKHRVCIRDWSITQPVAEDWLIERHHVQGQRSAGDPSYAALGLKHWGPQGRLGAKPPPDG